MYFGDISEGRTSAYGFIHLIDQFMYLKSQLALSFVLTLTKHAVQHYYEIL